MINLLDNLKGNDILRKNLLATINGNKLSHSYIIEGKIGSGRHTLSAILASAIVCTSENNKPCGICRDCKKILHKSHPDIINIDLLKDRKTIGVEPIREMCNSLYISPNEAVKKVYIINNAHLITLQAQNVLLKSIEEPPPFVAFIFIMEEGNELIPTVVSRCVKLSLSPVKEIEVLNYLNSLNLNAKEEKIYEAVRLSEGLIGKALNILKDNSKNKLKGHCDSFFEALLNQKEYDFIKLSDKCAGKERDTYNEFLDVLYTFLRDVSVYKISKNENNLIFFDRRLNISSFSDKMTNRQILKLMDYTMETINALEQNCNLSLWTNSFFAKCWEEVH